MSAKEFYPRRAVTIVVLVALLAAVVAEIAVAAEKTKLDLWIVDFNEPARRLYEESVLPAFEAAHPDIDVELSYMSWNVYQDKFIAGWAAGAGPDVFNAGPHWLGGIAERGLARPIDDYIDSWPDAGEFFPISWEAVTWKGQKFGVPQTQSSWSLIWRADKFDQSGLGSGPNAFPTTWEGLKEIMPKLTRVDNQDHVTQLGVTVPDTGPGMLHWWVALLYQAGGKFVSDDGERPMYNSPAGLEAAEYYLSLYELNQNLGQIPKGMSMVDGQIAVQYANPGWFIPAARQSAPETIPYYRTSSPLMGNRKIGMTYTNFMSMSSLTKHPDEAWELIKWLTTADNLVSHAQAMLTVPPRRDALDSDYVQNSAITQQEIREVMPYTTPWPSHHGANQRNLRNIWPKVMSREITPQQALRDAAAAWVNW